MQCALVGDMTRSPAGPLDVVRDHYRRMAGSLILGKTVAGSKRASEARAERLSATLPSIEEGQ